LLTIESKQTQQKVPEPQISSAKKEEPVKQEPPHPSEVKVAVKDKEEASVVVPQTSTKKKDPISSHHPHPSVPSSNTSRVVDVALDNSQEEGIAMQVLIPHIIIQQSKGNLDNNVNIDDITISNKGVDLLCNASLKLQEGRRY
jgi:hypothetical protein